MQDAEITETEVEDLKGSKDTSDEVSRESEEEVEPEGTSGEAEPEKAIKQKDLESTLAQTTAQKDRYRKKYSESLKKIEGLEKSTKVSPDMPSPTSPMEVVKLAKALEGYNEDEVDFIVRNASDKSVSGIIDATKDEWVETAIGAKRLKVEGEKKAPSPSSPSQSLGGKTGDDVESMSDTQYSKWLRENMSVPKGRMGV